MFEHLLDVEELLKHTSDEMPLSVEESHCASSLRTARRVEVTCQPCLRGRLLQGVGHCAAVRLALRAHHHPEEWDWRTDEDMPAAAARPALWMSALDEVATSGRPVAAGARHRGIAL